MFGISSLPGGIPVSADAFSFAVLFCLAVIVILLMLIASRRL
jgi:hypothetical protein